MTKENVFKLFCDVFLKFCSTDSCLMYKLNQNSFNMYLSSLLSSFLACRQFFYQFFFKGITSCVGIRFPTANSARPQGLVWLNQGRLKHCWWFQPKHIEGQSEERKRKRQREKRSGFKLTDGRKKMNKPLSGSLTETISSVTLTLTPLLLYLHIYPSSLHFSLIVYHFIILSHIR